MMPFTRRGFLATTGAMLWSTTLGAATSDLVQIKGPAFGASWRVRVGAGANSAQIGDAMMQIIAGVDQAMSPYLPQSEISRLNHMETSDWLPLGPAALATLAEAKHIASLTQGAFDPTLGGIVGRYGFGPITGAPAGAFGDMDVTANGVRKAHPRQTLDLCGIAKGYALDQMVAAMVALGHKDVFVELGGEVAARGVHPAGRPWRAGIESPLPGATRLRHRVAISNEALATSGDRINSFVHEGHRYSHIIDPARKRPVDTPLASVSVFDPSAITADALATALFAMGPDKGTAFAAANQIPALFIVRDRSILREEITAGFDARFTG